MDVNNRDKKEREIARRLARVFGDHFEEVMEQMGDPPRFENIPEEYWQQYNVDIRTALNVTLNTAFFNQFMEAMEGFGLSFDDAEASADALEFIQGYMFDLVNGIVETTRTGLRKEITAFLQNGDMTIDDLAQRLYRYYSPNRAEMIAITEVTRAAVEGEEALIKKLEQEYGVEYELIWLTANDERVCTYCGPRHNKVVERFDRPPAHPRCRCTTAYRRKGEGDEEYFDYALDLTNGR